MDNFRDSYFQVDWDLTTKRLRGTYWGKQYDTGRGFAVTVINGGQVVAPTNEVLRLKWEKPDNTTGYVNATIVNGKFIVENIDQMFTLHGSVRADFELSVGGKFVASITFYVNVEKAVGVDAVASSSQFTALQDAVGSVDSLQQQFNNVVANVTVDSEVIAARGTEATLGARLDDLNSNIFFTELHSGEWEQGTIFNGINDPNLKRIRTKDFSTFKYGAIVKAEPGYQVAMSTFNSNGSFIEQTTWLEGLEIPPSIDNKYRFALSKTDVSDIVPSESTNVKIILNDVDYEKYLTDKVKRETLDEVNYKETTIPEYFKTEIDEISEKIKNNTTEKSMIFPIITDSHINESRKSDFSLTCNNINEIGKNHPFDGLIHLGDIIDGTGNPVAERSYIDFCMSELRKIDNIKNNTPNLFLLKGNHDDISYGTNIADRTTLSDGELYSKVHRHNEVGVERSGAKSYYYKDFDSVGVRFIFLNSVDIGYGRDAWGYSQAQVDWVTNVALNTDYNVLVLTHNPLLGAFNLNNTPIQGATTILNVLENWQTSEKRVISVISGHSHGDITDEISNSFPQVSLANNKVQTYTSESIPVGAVSPTRTLKTATEDLWDIMVLKLESKKVKFIRFGAGEDREVSY